MEDMFRVGVVTTTHGIKGEVKVFPTTDDFHRFDYLQEVLIRKMTKNGMQQQMQPAEVAGVKYFKNQVILKLKGFDTVEAAETLRNAELYVTRENAIPLEENEYYISDLIGLNVVTDEGKTLGVLTDVLQTGANDVYVVVTPEKKEILLPVIDECVLDIDLEKQQCLIHLMPGLLD